MEAAVKQAVAVHLGHPEGDILIFMTGQEEIEATCFSLQVRSRALRAAPQYSSLPAATAGGTWRGSGAADPSSQVALCKQNTRGKQE